MDIATAPKTGLVLNDDFALHEAYGLPERPERIARIRQGLTETGLIDRCERIDLPPASDEAARRSTLEHIKRNHSPEYVDDLARAFEQGLPMMSGNREAPIGCKTFETAWRATHSVLSAVDGVMRGELRNAFCAVRPPGHHAEFDHASGFCYVNHLAVAARYLREEYQLRRVLMVDIDLHHGNGTQHSFFEDPDFLFCSIQPHPSVLPYPGTGFEHERGKHDNILNIALPGATSATKYLSAFEHRFLRRADDYRPQMVLVSCGFDTYVDDPLNQGRIALQSEDFGRLAGLLVGLAEHHCNGRLVSVLEGGYNLKMLGACVANYVKGLVAGAADSAGRAER